MFVYVRRNVVIFSVDIEQHLYTLWGIGFPVSKLASEGYIIFHNGRI